MITIAQLIAIALAEAAILLVLFTYFLLYPLMEQREDLLLGVKKLKIELRYLREGMGGEKDRDRSSC